MNADLQLRLGPVDENSSNSFTILLVSISSRLLCANSQKIQVSRRNLLPIRRDHLFELTLATVGMPVKATDGAAANKAAQASFLRNIVAGG